ncbi:MAG: universal stress protein [Bradyrhizobium sp.]|uniref:universal stress protein n=1 Tax=Bradyrhizobium sp. TaxID=376 RepID=UPI001C29590A|nr:universal stress protein [Bradyrhizobium sp.]MBU6463866.1 universal stress protein [Pseudomonadota bacterium]MDE2065888.1 universal stress protein [Bradyrhizobium sp.]MDE2468996.1 universal stress protein [Bradyrhizobium sp.]
MYQHILVATDGTELAGRAIKHGVNLAKALGAKLTAVTMTEPFHWFDANMVEGAETAYLDGANRAAAAALGVVVDAAKEAGLPCETVHIKGTHPYEAIIGTAREKKCDLIVMASHGRRGLSAVVLGSETVKVLTHSTIPVLVCH